MTIADKIRWTAGLLVTFLLILATGRTSLLSTRKVQAAVESLYADRLVVKNLIFELVTTLHAKELAVVTQDVEQLLARGEVANARIEELLVQFRATQLVPLEDATLGACRE